MNKKKVFLLLVMFAWGSHAENGICLQNVPGSPQQRFEEAIRLFSNGSLEDAARGFGELASVRPLHSWSSVSLLMQAQALYGGEEYHAVIGLLQGFAGQFPESKYCGYAFYVLGNAYYRIGERRLALREYLAACSHQAGTGELGERAARNAIRITAPDLTPDYLDELGQRFTDGPARDILRIKQIQSLVRGGDYAAAGELLNSFENSGAVSMLADETEKLRNYIRDLESQPLLLGAVLNVSSTNDDESKQFFNGLKLAVDQYNRKSKLPVSIILRNAEGSSIGTIKAMEGLLEYNRLIAVVGPLEPDLVIACAAFLAGDKSGVPLLVPRAQDSGIASLSPWVFQLAADYRTEGRVLGEYATSVLGLRTFATFSPVTKDAQELTSSFVAAIRKNNGMIVNQEVYYPGTINFDRQFSELRKACWAFRPEKQVISSQLDSKLDSLEAAYFGNVRSQEIGRTDTSLLYDTSLDIPVTSLDALYMPVAEEDIKYFAPKIALYNFRTQLLGAGGWNNSATLSTQENYVNGVYFTAKNAFSEYNMDFVNFRNLYRQYVHATPGRSAVFGYDCANLILACLDDGVSSREAFRRSLAAVDGFTGITGIIRFDDMGANTWVPVARYRDGAIEFITGK